jgi:formate hydrogenlyase subunit 6/NADH:ubiquinone oxidoreductase subunit I
MDAIVLADRAAVDELRRAIAAARTLVEPRTVAGAAEWQVTGGEGAFEWTAAAPLTGAKPWFFPPREPLLRWDAAAEPGEALPAPAPFALFGLRSCDLAAIAYQDRFFAGDPWYGTRRAAAFLVGLDCVTACDGGFCVEVDAGPFARAPYDLDLTPLPDGRVVVAWGSAEGRAVLAAAGLAATPGDDAVARIVAELAAAAAASFPERPFVARGLARMNAAPAAAAIADEEWQALGPSCLACTGCTSLCPTCSCFTVVDEVDPAGGARVRLWDSCLLEGFQREASGHHPAPRPGDRVRRFWYHKLSQDFARDFGRLGCVGCGRCDVTCPGTIGALRVLAALGSER